MPYKIYYNSKKKVFSLLYKGKVIGHTLCITLEGAQFTVNEYGRKKVLREKRKNVHAFIIGTPTDHAPQLTREVHYNPYLHSQFMCGETPVKSAQFVRCEMVDGKPVVNI